VAQAYISIHKYYVSIKNAKNILRTDRDEDNNEKVHFMSLVDEAE